LTSMHEAAMLCMILHMLSEFRLVTHASSCSEELAW
jgi:hypothetical protein